MAAAHGGAVSAPAAPRPPVVDTYTQPPVADQLVRSVPPPADWEPVIAFIENIALGGAYPDGDSDHVRLIRDASNTMAAVLDEVGVSATWYAGAVTGSGSGAATDAFAAYAAKFTGDKGEPAQLAAQCRGLAQYLDLVARTIDAGRLRFWLSIEFFLLSLALAPLLGVAEAALLPMIRAEGFALRAFLVMCAKQLLIGAWLCGGLNAVDQISRIDEHLQDTFKVQDVMLAAAQGAVAGLLMAGAQGGLTALSGRWSALSTLIDLMGSKGPLGVLTRLAVGGTIGTGANLATEAMFNDGHVDVAQAVEAGFGMAAVGEAMEAGRSAGERFFGLADGFPALSGEVPSHVGGDAPVLSGEVPSHVGGDAPVLSGEAPSHTGDAPIAQAADPRLGSHDGSAATEHPDQPQAHDGPNRIERLLNAPADHAQPLDVSHDVAEGLGDHDPATSGADRLAAKARDISSVFERLRTVPGVGERVADLLRGVTPHEASIVRAHISDPALLKVLDWVKRERSEVFSVPGPDDAITEWTSIYDSAGERDYWFSVMDDAHRLAADFEAADAAQDPDAYEEAIEAGIAFVREHGLANVNNNNFYRFKGAAEVTDWEAFKEGDTSSGIGYIADVLLTDFDWSPEDLSGFGDLLTTDSGTSGTSGEPTAPGVYQKRGDGWWQKVGDEWRPAPRPGASKPEPDLPPGPGTWAKDADGNWRPARLPANLWPPSRTSPGGLPPAQRPAASAPPPGHDDFGPIDVARRDAVPLADLRPMRTHVFDRSNTPLSKLEEGMMRNAHRTITGIVKRIGGNAVKLGDLLEIVQHVNPTGNRRNCAEASIAIDDILRGRPAVAGPLPGVPVPIARSAYKPRSVDARPRLESIADVERLINEAGPGSRGIIIANSGTGTSHVYNVININGKIYYIDGQVRRIYPGAHPANGRFKEYDFYRTA